MTGLFNAGFNKAGSAHEHGVDYRVTYLSEYLRRAGYQVGGFGKWHLGSRDGDHPLDRGFDHWIGFYGGFMRYHWVEGRESVFDGKTPYKKRWKHSTDLFADEAIRFIRDNRSRAFLYTSHSIPFIRLFGRVPGRFFRRDRTGFVGFVTGVFRTPRLSSLTLW